MSGDRQRDEQRWRKTAYLHAENWPEAIPPEGPKTEYGVYPWGQPSHDQYGIDEWEFTDSDQQVYKVVAPYC